MSMRRLHSRPGHQRGITLIVTMVLLAALALLAVTAFNSGTTNMRIVGNMQTRQEALSAAQAALDLTISSGLFATETAAVAAGPIPVDIGGKTYTASLAAQPPVCYRARTLPTGELDPSVASDISCMGSSGASTAGLEIVGTAALSGDSLCADAEWAIRAVVSDPSSNTTAAVNQGVSTRILITDVATNCPP
ncbi:MAG: PilX N-terminal domain-containing pilus assembly protein [Burkholderiaceae bacterium]|nr:PilX N-terminal domain-containing pilus assembly protein [Burkholderiaceae bacterium]